MHRATRRAVQGTIGSFKGFDQARLPDIRLYMSRRLYCHSHTRINISSSSNRGGVQIIVEHVQHIPGFTKGCIPSVMLLCCQDLQVSSVYVHLDMFFVCEVSVLACP